MRKEPIIAVIVGSILGLTVAYFAWSKSVSGLRNDSVSNAQVQKETDEPVTSENNSSQFESFAIISPENNTVLDNSQVEIKGIAAKSTFIGVSSIEENLISKTDVNGNFNVEVEAGGGLNLINIWEFTPGTGAQIKKINVVLTTELADPGSKTGNETQDKLNEAANKPLAIYGTVTDLSEATVQLRTNNGQIEQVSITSDGTTYANIIGKTKDTSFSELAIGDFIVVLGYKNGKTIVEAKRILVTTEIDDKSIGIIGIIKTLSKSDFSVTDYNNLSYSIDATGTVEVTVSDEFKKVKLTQTAKEGDEVIILGEKAENGDLLASKIHILAIN